MFSTFDDVAREAEIKPAEEKENTPLIKDYVEGFTPQPLKLNIGDFNVTTSHKQCDIRNVSSILQNMAGI